ncbi:MAG: hypothetical protein ACOYJD_01065 [Christensenellales bacterium]|jgi:hypothetical protein
MSNYDSEKNKPEETEVLQGEVVDTETEGGEEEVKLPEINIPEKTFKILQIVVGIVLAAATYLFMQIEPSEDNMLLSYLFLVPFLIYMFGSRQVETKYGVRLKHLRLSFLGGLIVSLIIFVILSIIGGKF